MIVTFPGLELVWDDGTRVHAGDVAVPITPREGGIYDFKVALPAHFEISDAAGPTTSVMTLGASTISGSWTEVEAVLRDFDAALRDIEVVSTAAGGPPVLSIAALDARHTLHGGSGGAWGGTFETELSGVRARGGPELDQDVTIRRTGLAVSFEGFTAADWYALSGERSFLGADQPTAPGDAEVPTGSAQGNAELGLSGVEFTDGASASATVREAGLRLDVGRGTQDLWDVIADLSLSDLVVDDDPRVAIGEIALNSRTTDYPLARWRALADRFGLDLAGGMAAQGEQQQRELADALRGMRWGSSTAEFGLTRLAVGPAAAALVALDEGSFRFAFDGREALASIAYGVRAAGLFVADPDVPAELVPRQAGIELAIENLPPEVFILPALTALESGGNTGAISGAMLGQILMSEAPSAIVVESFDYDAAALGVSGSGRVSSDAGPGAFVGEFDVAVRDLERFEALVAAAERDGAAWVQGSISAACVAALREVGEPGPPAAKGAEPAHLYHVAV